MRYQRKWIKEECIYWLTERQKALEDEIQTERFKLESISGELLLMRLADSEPMWKATAELKLVMYLIRWLKLGHQPEDIPDSLRRHLVTYMTTESFNDGDEHSDVAQMADNYLWKAFAKLIVFFYERV